MSFYNVFNGWNQAPIVKEKDAISPMQVMQSAAGYYIGHSCYDQFDGPDSMYACPYDRCSDYIGTFAEAIGYLFHQVGNTMEDVIGDEPYASMSVREYITKCIEDLDIHIADAKGASSERGVDLIVYKTIAQVELYRLSKRGL